MNRRDLLSSMVLAALNAEAQESAAPSPSLYIPNAHRVEDLKLLHDFMDEFAFVDLVTSSPFRITHIPVLVDRSAGPFGTIHGHIARNNVQTKAFDGAQEAVIVFRGPHGYISPTLSDQPRGAHVEFRRGPRYRKAPARDRPRSVARLSRAADP